MARNAAMKAKYLETLNALMYKECEVDCDNYRGLKYDENNSNFLCMGGT